MTYIHDELLGSPDFPASRPCGNVDTFVALGGATHSPPPFQINGLGFHRSWICGADPNADMSPQARTFTWIGSGDRNFSAEYCLRRRFVQ